jgi:hypothetical protein
MARATWSSGSPLVKFADGYRRHRTDRRAVREWTSARLRRHSALALKRWLSEESARTAADLAVLRGMSENAKIRRAIANAEDHQKWLRLARTEIGRHRPIELRPPPARPTKGEKAPARRQRISKKERQAQAQEIAREKMAAGSSARKRERAAKANSPEVVANAESIKAAQAARMAKVIVERRRLPPKPVKR